MQHPVANEPSWTAVPNSDPVTYTRYSVLYQPLVKECTDLCRPLLGAEFTHDLGHRLSDGYVQAVRRCPYRLTDAGSLGWVMCAWELLSERRLMKKCWRAGVMRLWEGFGELV